ncbi:MFS transporter [Methanoregula sp. UBA64]|jgi:MFS transporter, ACDE family, multidrug resistance protein|uniref:MFS transporter n=1 Tax=Methanoregula sp. UBA64 TaxID=1915554 RepID=UPI0025FF646F|nr:MFS transporter [Methanoregula sp. UBA64]
MLCIVAFFSMAGGALLAPVLPEMVGPLHTTAQNVALLMSVFTISTAVFTLVIGHFTDRVNRKRILIPCLVIYGITGLVSFFVADFASLLVLRFLQGIGVAGMTTLAMLVIGDVYSGLDRVAAMSKISITFALGSVFAPVIGGGLAIFGWNYAFLFFALSLPFAVLVILYLPETRNQAAVVHHEGMGGALKCLKDLPILATVFMGFSIFFLLFAMMIYVPFMLKGSFGYASGASGLMLAVPGITCILCAPQVRPLTGKYSLPLVIVAGFICVGLSMLFLACAQSVASVVLLLLLFGVGLIFAQTAIDVQLIQLSPPATRGGVIAIHSCMKYVGQSAAPIVLGIILVFFGLSAVFVVAGILGVLVALVTFAMKRRFSGPAGQPA